MEHHVSFLGDIGMVLVVASAASVVFRLLKLPSLLGYLVAGLAVGPYIPIPIFADPARVEALAEFGVVLVMFAVGLEFSLARLVSVLPKAGFTPFVRSSLSVVLFLLGVSILGVFLWRDAKNFQGHVRAGAEVMIELLARQRASESGIHDVEIVLPGLDGLVSLRIEPGTIACGATLAKLNLRAATGATVLAIRRGDAGVVTPNGHEVLEPGDVLALSGTEQAIASAGQLLEQRAGADATGVPEASTQDRQS